MSPLQQQYPLSPRKFWKKFIGKLIFWGIVCIIVAGFSLFVSVISASSDTTTAQAAGGIALAVLILTIAGLAVYAWYLRVYIRRYYYDAGDNFVTIKKGVFAPAEIHVQYPKIQDVYVDQDILDRIMGLYDVHIASATATSGMEAHIDGVEHEAAEGLKNLLLNRIQGGGAMPAANSQAATPQASGPVSFGEDISSRTYPLSGAWIAQSLVSYFFSAFFLSLIISFWIYSPGRDSASSLGDSLPIGWDGVWFWSFVAIFGFHVIYALIWRSTFWFEFLPEYALMRSGVVSRSEVHVPYRTIQDVVVSQGIIERMFGLATVNLQNAAAPQMVGKRTISKGGVTIPGQSLEKANHISDIIKKVALSKNSAQTGL